MTYRWLYKTSSDLDDILMYSDGKYLTALLFENSKDASKHNEKSLLKNLPIFVETSKWLDTYFKGIIPDFIPKYKLSLTPFQKEVADIMNLISFGETLSYNDIAKIIAKNRGIVKMSAQAVGHAVGSNPICIIIPCHRVIGANGSLVGYGGGLNNKIALLRHENAKYRKC